MFRSRSRHFQAHCILSLTLFEIDVTTTVTCHSTKSSQDVNISPDTGQLIRYLAGVKITVCVLLILRSRN
jgi:hypothetical protein